MKKAYSAPRLTTYGTVEALTRHHKPWHLGGPPFSLDFI